MIKKRYNIELKKDQGLILYCLGDVGFAGPRCDETELLRDFRYLQKKKKEGYLIRVVGLGDWLAFPSPSERAAMIAAKSGKGFYDSTLAILDEAMQERCDKWIKTVEPFHGDFLGTVHGHHFFEFSPESEYRRLNSDQYICHKLKCDYYGDIGYIVLSFPQLKKNIELIVHHGYGSGRTKGSAINKRIRVFEGFPTTDIVLLGHDNTRMVDCANGIYWEGAQEKRVIGTGSYERAYRLGQVHNGYVETGLMNPSAIGGTMILFEGWEGKLRVRALV